MFKFLSFFRYYKCCGEHICISIYLRMILNNFIWESLLYLFFFFPNPLDCLMFWGVQENWSIKLNYFKGLWLKINPLTVLCRPCCRWEPLGDLTAVTDGTVPCWPGWSVAPNRPLSSDSGFSDPSLLLPCLCVTTASVKREFGLHEGSRTAFSWEELTEIL